MLSAAGKTIHPNAGGKAAVNGDNAKVLMVGAAGVRPDAIYADFTVPGTPRALAPSRHRDRHCRLWLSGGFALSSMLSPCLELSASLCRQRVTIGCTTRHHRQESVSCAAHVLQQLGKVAKVATRRGQWSAAARRSVRPRPTGSEWCAHQPGNEARRVARVVGFRRPRHSSSRAAHGLGHAGHIWRGSSTAKPQ